jgi:hypothetical protein
MPECSDELCGWTASVPDGGFMRGDVWDCGDEWCDCGRAYIEHFTRDTSPWKNDLTSVWQGTFQTDGDWYRPANEWKDAPASDTELSRMARHLRKHHRALYARIAWPWGGPHLEVKTPDIEDAT